MTTLVTLPLAASDPLRAITNQPPPFAGYNLYQSDRALRDYVAAHDAAWAAPALTAWGETLGRAETQALADLANRHPPELHLFDRTGQRIDHVEFDPAWHALMQMATSAGEHSSPWTDPKRGAQVARAAAYFMHGQVENGTQCPLTMTYSAVPLLRRHAASLPALGESWLPKILVRDYDPRPLPAVEKRALLVGMGMTEKQSGSDVRMNTTRAEPVSVQGPGGVYKITGHKWFFSAPMCDAHLVLAQAGGGLSCFLLPRVTAEGSLNGVREQRLKDKVGNRSNASSEVEFHGASAWLLGAEGRGVATIIEMVAHTRLDCVIGSAGLTRAATLQALHHASHRTAFGRLLAQQPLMQNVLADLALESEAATAATLYLASLFEADPNDQEGDAALLRRLLTPAIKFWICKRAPIVAAEAMEVLGGNGYVEESPLPRIYRETPLNSIWEGSGNVMCLDVLRAVGREPRIGVILIEALSLAQGADPALDRAIDHLRDAFARPLEERGARAFCERIVIALQAALLFLHAPTAVATAFARTRLDPRAFAIGGRVFGAIEAEVDCDALIARALPAD